MRSRAGAGSPASVSRSGGGGGSRTYALFLQSGKIVDGRYAVETDGCGTQAYAPFGLMTGGLQPLH
jgi:hypothetical protein